MSFPLVSALQIHQGVSVRKNEKTNHGILSRREQYANVSPHTLMGEKISLLKTWCGGKTDYVLSCYVISSDTDLIQIGWVMQLRLTIYTRLENI